METKPVFCLTNGCTAIVKRYSVAQALDGGKWKRGMHRITTSEQLTEFVNLWSMLTQLQRTERPDSISWRFTGNGAYSPNSAYHAQFIGTFADHEWQRVWKSKVDNKCNLFAAWLLLQNRLWTADRILRHGDQANSVCQLCRTHQEFAVHMVSQCSFTKQLCVHGDQLREA
jgi:hypothetical protein